MNKINQAELVLKAKFSACCKTNDIPKREEDTDKQRETQRTCLLSRAKLCTLLLNKCTKFCEVTLTFGWSCCETFSLAVRLLGVFQVASRGPKSLTTCETSIHEPDLLELAARATI